MSHFAFTSESYYCHHEAGTTSTATTCRTANKSSQRHQTPPRRWFERMIRGGRLARHLQDDSHTFIGSKQQQQDKYYSLLDEYHRLYRLVEEEISFATETQGSVYYAEDLAAAKKALEQWLDCHDALNSIIVDRCELTALVKGYESAKKSFYNKLKHLPLPQQ